MKFRTKDLEKYLKRKVDWKKVAEELTLKSFESSYQNGILEVDILPNRYADASSIIGILKELKRIGLIKNFKEPLIRLVGVKKHLSKIKIINQASQAAPYYFGKVILNVQNKKSPLWLKEFVEFYGFNSINFMVDLANFVMIEYGAPLHIFDLGKIVPRINADKTQKDIYVRLARKGEKFISLENKEYILEGGEIVIADQEKILALAGIKGGKVAEVDLKTKNIFIEAAVFDPQKIYETSRRLNLKTEAGFRFERKVAPIRSLLALERLSSLIQKDLGGQVLEEILGYQSVKSKRIKFNFNRTEKISGIKIGQKEFSKILKLLEIKKNGNYLILPGDRLDLNSEEDIIEEIVRLYGWNKIKGEFEISLNEVFVDERIKFNNYLRQLLTKLGYNEGYNYNFYGEKEKELVENLLGFKLAPVQVLNPISENYQYFQLSLLPNLLKAVYPNQFNFKTIRLFNIEKIAFKDKKIQEKYNLGIVFAFKDFLEILKELKGVLRVIFEELKLNFELKQKNNLLAEVLSNRESVGFFGLFPRKYLESFKIDLDVGFIELNLDKLIKQKTEIKKFISWPVFPGIYRDLSFYIDEKVRFEQVKNELKKLRINYLTKIELVDIYFPQGSQNKKSFTIRLHFFHPQRSLEEKEIEPQLSKVQEFLTNRFKVEFR